jgi:CRISPR-associated protein Cas5d
VSRYTVSFEISGPIALWVRPDSGAAFVSYPAPTYSAVQGILDCIARWKTAYLQPQRVEICSPIQTMRWVTNYGGAERNPAKLNASYQLYATVLVDVCYKIHAVARESARAPDHANHLHGLQELFYRRLDEGKLFRTPCLGWSEMTPSYLGRLRETTEACEEIDLTIPSMLHSSFSAPNGGRYAPHFRQNVRVEKGVLDYAQ